MVGGRHCEVEEVFAAAGIALDNSQEELALAAGSWETQIEAGIVVGQPYPPKHQVAKMASQETDAYHWVVGEVFHVGVGYLEGMEMMGHEDEEKAIHVVPKMIHEGVGVVVGIVVC